MCRHCCRHLPLHPGPAPSLLCDQGTSPHPSEPQPLICRLEQAYFFLGDDGVRKCVYEPRIALVLYFILQTFMHGFTLCLEIL